MEKIKKNQKILTDYETIEPDLWKNANNSSISLHNECNHVYFDTNFLNIREKPQIM